MSEIISENEKSRLRESSSTESQEVTRMIKRLRDIAELWSAHANNEYEFGVLKGLQIAIETLEGK